MCCSKACRPSLDRDGIASDIDANVDGVREVHHMHVWSLDGSKNMATLHACLDEGADAHVAVRAIKARLARKFGITHATVEPEFGRCADDGNLTPALGLGGQDGRQAQRERSRW